MVENSFLVTTFSAEKCTLLRNRETHPLISSCYATLQKRNQVFERVFCADFPLRTGLGRGSVMALRGTSLPEVSYAACRPWRRCPRPSVHSYPRDAQRAHSARGDMWALLGRQTLSTGPRRGHVAGRAARAVSSVPQSNLAASSARAAMRPPLGLFARPWRPLQCRCRRT